MKLKRFAGNPILEPLPSSPWENVCTTNPGAWFDGREVHLLYRGGADDRHHYISLGHAASRDGLRFQRRSRRPVFGPSRDGFDAGCIEDARIVRLGAAYYVTYAARLAPPGPYWKGLVPLEHHVPAYGAGPGAPAAARWNLTRSGLAVTPDFRRWRRLGPITDPTVDDRDAILFPEPVAGRYYLFHRPATRVGRRYASAKPSMWLSSSTDLLRWDNHALFAEPAFAWESRKIGGSAPPIKTSRGWLVLYHGVDEKTVYRVGAMLLDLQTPRRVLGRTREPILEPATDYEKHGLVPNVVFPCGNVVVDGTLFVYYGGADRVCCVATAPLDRLVRWVAAQRWSE